MAPPLHRLAAITILMVALGTMLVGCSSDVDTVRQIQTQRHREMQAQSKHDHLGEAFSLLQRLVELNPEKAYRQIAYHLNRWRETKPDSNPVPAPELLRTLGELLPVEAVAERIEREEFVASDINHLRDAYLFGQLVRWVDSERSDDPLLDQWLTEQQQTLGEDDAQRLRTAARLFDWTARNIAYEPPEMPVPFTDLPPLPPGLKYGGAGYRQSDYLTLWRGTGDSLQRAGVFMQLCRQASIPAFVLSIQSLDTGELKPWCVGVLVGDQIYLFEPELGTHVPGPDQVGIATLEQARSDEVVLRRLNVPGFFDYHLSKQDVQQCTALLNVIPEGVSSRMKNLESGLTGDRRMIVYTDVDSLAKQIDEATGIAGVRLWQVPLQAEVYRAAVERVAARNPAFGFWHFTRWAIMDAPAELPQKLSEGRWRHLHGQFDSVEEENLEGARKLYLTQRAPEFEIEKLGIDVELQKLYGIRRELGMDPKAYEQQVQQIQGMMQLGKRTATYWLSLIQYEDRKYETAESWLVKRALDEDQQSFWVPAARYNLGRAVEQLGQHERAIELYKTDGDLQEHGNRIRARLVAKAAK